jgi:signal peptidase I
MKNNKKTSKRRWWLAGLLSYLLPGLGQVYNGQALKGLFFNFIFTLWGGIVFTLIFHVAKQEITGLKILLLFMAILISFAAHLYVIIESIRTARKKGASFQPEVYNRWFIYMAAIFICLMIDHAVTTAIKENVIKPYRIAAASMEPSLKAGDFIIGNQMYFSTHNPERRDIVLFKNPADKNMDFIKRIIGMPGDTLQIIDKEVWINGEKLNESYTEFMDSTILAQYKTVRDNFGPFLLSPNSYFVMGDNRDNSLDSRQFGTIKRHQIKGKLSFIYFSWDNTIPAWKIFHKLFSIRFNRIGKIID